MKTKIDNRNKRIIIITIVALFLIPIVIAANDPGHDILYIEQNGDSELNGSFNVTSNASLKGVTSAGVGLTIYGNGFSSSTGTIPYISGASGSNLYLETPSSGSIYLKYNGGSAVYIGVLDRTDLNVSGALYVAGLNYSAGLVCLLNGSYCPSSLGGANITGGGTINTIAKFTAAGTIGNSVITEINAANVSIDNGVLFVDGTNNRVGIGTTSPNTTLHVSGRINVTSGNDICIDGGKCLGASGTGSGTVTSITFNTSGLLGGTISTTGTVALNDTYIATIVGNWSADKPNYINQTYANATYYLKTNPLNFYNLSNITALAYIDQTYGNNTYYLKTNPSQYYNLSNITLLGYMNQTYANATYINITTGSSYQTGTEQNNYTTGFKLNTTGSTLQLTINTLGRTDIINITTMNDTSRAYPGTASCGAGLVLQNVTFSATGAPISNCTTPAAGGNLSAQGATVGYIPRFQNGTILNNSIISQSGNTLTINGNVNLTTYNVSAVNCIVFDTGGKICSGA